MFLVDFKTFFNLDSSDLVLLLTSPIGFQWSLKLTVENYGFITIVNTFVEKLMFFIFAIFIFSLSICSIVSVKTGAVFSPVSQKPFVITVWFSTTSFLAVQYQNIGEVSLALKNCSLNLSIVLIE